MYVLAFRHVPFEGLGLIEASLRDHGIGCEVVDLWDSGALPEIAGAGGLIFMGGPMSANDDLGYLRQEERLIREATSSGMPVLGVCLGAQLAARALGGAVRRNLVKEIGWFDIHMTSGAEADPLFAGIAGPETVFHWHGETFDLPRGSLLLARSERCEHQAFRAGANVYGLQFHLEVTPEMVADWCRQDANCGDVRELDGPIDAHANAERLRELARAVFGRWCGLVAAPGAKLLR